MSRRWTDHRDRWGLDATVANRTDDYAMLALQGPETPTLLRDAVDEPTDTAVRGLSRFGLVELSVAGVGCLVSRTGYTGEDGFELLVPRADAEVVWRRFADDHGVRPCDLGARDTLRIEMGYLLSGRDFDPETDPPPRTRPASAPSSNSTWRSSGGTPSNGSTRRASRRSSSATG